MTTIRLTPLAEADIEAIAAYLVPRDPQAAQHVEDAVQDALAALAAHPMVGREMRDDVRRYVIPRYPYVIYYRVVAADDALDVLTIRHTSRRPLA